MRLSTRGRYGVRAMLDLALCCRGSPVSLRDMAARQDISGDYLEQLLRKLRKAELVRSVRGPRGGFMLARSPEEIRVWEIVDALEEEVAPVHCVDEIAGRRSRKKPCQRTSDCATHLLWAGLARQIRDYLEGKTLQNLADDVLRVRGRAAPGNPVMFFI